MKRIVQLLFISILICSSLKTFSQLDKQDRLLLMKERELIKKNKIRSRELQLNDSTSKESSGKFVPQYREQFDIDGNSVSIFNFLPHTYLSDSSVYDGNNNRIKWIIYMDKEIVLYKYDTLNRIINKIEKSFTDSVFKNIVYSYDNSGNQTVIEETYSKDEKDRSILIYDKKGNLKEARNDNNGNKMKWCDYKYDSHSNEIKYTTYDRKGILDEVVTTKYNKNDQPIELFCSQYGIPCTHKYYEYDAKGNLTKETSPAIQNKYNLLSSYGSTTTYKYDDNGLLTEKETHSTDNPEKYRTITKYIYEKYP